jgi:hypothetical protein
MDYALTQGFNVNFKLWTSFGMTAPFLMCILPFVYHPDHPTTSKANYFQYFYRNLIKLSWNNMWPIKVRNEVSTHEASQTKTWIDGRCR